ncbi:MAG: phage major capsid protein [Caldimonas sp.]
MASYLTWLVVVVLLQPVKRSEYSSMKTAFKLGLGFAVLAITATAALAAGLDPLAVHHALVAFLSDPVNAGALVLAEGAAAIDGAKVMTELRRIATEVGTFVAGRSETEAQLQARLLELEQKAARPKGASGGGDIGGMPTLGAQVEAAFDGERDAFRKMRSITLSVPMAAAVTTVQTGGAHGSQGAAVAGSTPTSLLGMLAPGDLAGQTSFHYPRLTSVVGGAAAQDAEGAAKAEASPVFTPITQAAITVAGWATCSEQSLNAAGGLQRAIDSFLTKSIRDAADAILVAGTAASQWPFAGFLALAATLTPTAGKGWTSIYDAAVAGATRMRTQGFAPSIVVLNEADYLTAQLAKGSDGHYLATEFATAGLQVALSSGVTAGKALLLDRGFCSVLMSGAVRITVAYVNDGLIKNLLTVRGDLEILPIFSHYQGALLVTPPAT